MEPGREGVVLETGSRAREGGIVCPSLILSARVVCDGGKTVHEPPRAHLREYCTTQLHDRCPLQIAAAARQELRLCRGRGTCAG